MAPKRWAITSQPRPSREAAAESLRRYISGELAANNCLGLSEEERDGMATELIESKTRTELFQWCTTLMMDESFAAEIVKRRIDSGLIFEGEQDSVAPSLPTATPPSKMSYAKLAKTLQVGKPRPVGGRQRKSGCTVTQQQLVRGAGTQGGPTSATLKPGHHKCGCFATVHKLRGSCANCGRIICEQEDDKVCYFCGLDPSRCVAYEIAVQEGQVSAAAQQRDRAQYEAAIAQRDKLLEYARQRAKRTTVIDDQAASMFSTQNTWLSPEERQQVQQSAAAALRQERVRRMLEHRGSYTVQLELIGQTVPCGVSNGQSVKIELVDSVAGPSSGNARGEGAESESAQDVVDSSSDASEYDEVGAGQVEGRAAPLPELLRSIWGGTTEGDKNSSSGGGGSIGIASTADVAPGRGAPATKDSEAARVFAAVLREPERAASRQAEVSRRVQQDYFTDDVNTFREAEAEAAMDELLFHPHAASPYVEQDSSDADEESGMIAGPAAVDIVATAAAQPVTTLAVSDNNGTTTEPTPRFAVTPRMRLADDGVCLSMHQPWASLLVLGIKRHEGRVWSTNFRGRLWIHAAAAEPTAIKATEQHYAPFLTPGQSFPSHYPTRVLLGYVYLTDCLDRATYEATFAPEERQEESPFSFICTEPKSLPFPLPMTGDHKLFSLDRRVHAAARKQLMEVPI